MWRWDKKKPLDQINLTQLSDDAKANLDLSIAPTELQEVISNLKIIWPQAQMAILMSFIKHLEMYYPLSYYKPIPCF